MTAACIVFNKVYKNFGSNTVLNNFNLTIKEKEVFTLMGQSGVGKSVALKCLLGLMVHDKGNVVRGKQTVTKLSEGTTRERMREIGVVFQGSALFDSLTIGENIMFSLDPFLKTQSQKKNKSMALQTLNQVGLSRKIFDLMPAEVSGGMAKRVAIARAIIHHPQFLFLDEPTTGLDPLSSYLIGQLICTIHQQSKVTTFTITHDIHLARAISNRIGLMDQGKLAWNGSFAEMKSSKLDLVKQLLGTQKLY